ncbi:sensor histidine kinase [Caulobacter mirabilis]|uniref:histidine kinase n=1 Tax=Caulobacter mirabilis TaxID=69666 RepID=A0A2D2AZW6_9CAUL|nr:HAMP domain-containing sensor histidine kinase [Caulobacter mirabilis]ATQ43542.1 two-component sensor histidine kinase [Caulobacter mirabilis]
MKSPRSLSLKRRLVIWLLLFQAGFLLLLMILLVGFLVRADMGGALVDPEITEIVARAVERDADGLVLRETAELAAFRKETPDVWFIARSDRGEIIESGPVPAPYRALGRHLDSISFADLRDTVKPFTLSAVIRRVPGPAGELTVLSGGRLHSLTFAILFLSNLLLLPILILLSLVTIAVTPQIVKRALNGLARTADQAAHIDADRRGSRLDEDGVPVEVTPLVRAINGALQRLDEGYERQQRFIADAAHELRTPIAIVQSRVDGLPAGPATERLRRDVARLAVICEQLLDLQRIERELEMTNVDLLERATTVAADLAPLLIANACEVEVSGRGPAQVLGDPGAIDRVVTSLVQNAIDHGGRQVIIRVLPSAIEVEDDGPGIPAEERERIFEPFHRLRARSTGAGLGLSLVRQVMERHHGRVVVETADGGGALIRLEFPERRPRRA